MGLLEEQINRAIHWTWDDITNWKADVLEAFLDPDMKIGYKFVLDKKVNNLIKKADLTECLTSPSEYIREYRKWYEANKDRKWYEANKKKSNV